jgi:hypothetical protein
MQDKCLNNKILPQFYNYIDFLNEKAEQISEFYKKYKDFDIEKYILEIFPKNTNNSLFLEQLQNYLKTLIELVF